MIVKDLIYNLSLLVSISILSGFVTNIFGRNNLKGKILQGILFGITAIIGMLFPFVLHEGLIFDGRSIVLSLVAFFFGPLAGIISAVMAAVLRIYLGGVGTLMGLSVIATSFLIGHFFYIKKNREIEEKVSFKLLYFMGILVHIAMLLSMSLLPSFLASETYHTVAITVIIVYPIITGLTGKILGDQIQRKHAFEIIKQNESLFRTTLYSIGDAVITTDIQGNIQTMNNVAESITGWTEGEVKGESHKKVFRIINEFDRKELEDPISMVIEKGKTVGLANHTILLSKIGKETPIADSAAPIISDNSEIIGVVLVFRDQTASRERERQIKEKEILLRTFLDNAPFEIWVRNKDSVGILENQIIRDSYGSILGKKPEYTNIPEETKQLWIKNNREVLQGRIINRDTEINVKGQKKYIQQIIFPVKMDNKIEAYGGFNIDITDRKLAEWAKLESEREFREIFNATTEAIFIHDAISGKIIDVNNHTLLMYDYNSKEEIIEANQENLNSNIEPFTNKIALQYIQRTIKGEQPRFEWYAKKKNGKLFWVEVTLKFIVINSKERVLAVVKDIDDRKQIEIELRSSEEKFREIFNNATDAIYVVDITDEGMPGKIREMNEQAQRMLGYTKEEFCQMTPKDLVGREKSVEVLDFMKVFKEKGKMNFEIVHLTKDGAKIPVEIRVHTLFLNGQNVILAMVRDITEKKRVEIFQKIQLNIANAALISKSSNELFQNVRNELKHLVNVNNFYIALYEEKTGMLYADVEEDEKDSIEYWPAERSMTGFVIKQNKTLLYNSNDIDKLVETGEIDLIGTKPYLWLGTPVKRGAKVIGAMVVQSYDNPYAFNNYSIEIFEAVARELSIYLERKMAEDENIKLLKAIEQSPVVILITDSMGRIEFVNPKFVEVTGYDKNEVLGQKPSILKSGIHSKEFYSELWATIKSGKEWQGEFHNKKKNGELYWESAIIFPIINEVDKIINYIAIKEIITEKKTMIEELVNAKEKAEEMNRVKSLFFANMSHELRTPFVGIMGYANLLADTLEDPESKEMAQGILRTSTRLIDTLSKILTITKIEFDKIVVNFEKVNVTSLLDEIYNQYIKTAQIKNIELIKNYSAEVKEVISDPILLREILLNLVSNAVKFTNEGNIKISSEIKEKEAGKKILVISVRDTGIGISKGKQNIIWEEFRQASEGSTRDFQGTGLGLSIVKKYVALLNGEISVKSEVGKGTKFTLTLPLG